ncbi:MAG: von Willebrand factor type A domain protein [bacterium ADurb.Bin478]|nr:MAG: von Willebrand factor type A domain protein [bacterium ADurb.Bin478]
MFLLDVSGSMSQPNKLPLVKQAMHILLEQLNEKDRVAIVTYAGTSGLALPSTTADKKRIIHEAIDALRPGGSTNGEAGIQLAYDIAKANAISGGANRVILATDGDFNVGTTSRDELLRVIEEKAKSGVFLTVLGFGMGNLKDSMMEQLADKGNGTYGYIDGEQEAKRLFARHATGSLVTIAKDVKIQVEFNPAKVGAYRLIGYENRALRAEDFNDDKKDAGEIGSGHTVTALYELVPPGEATGLSPVDDLKYQPKKRNGATAASAEMMTVKLRYKKPDGDTSDKIELAVTDAGANIAGASADMKFAASIAEVAMLLRDSPHKGSADWKSALELATAGKGADPHGDRAEFIELVRSAEKLADQR